MKAKNIKSGDKAQTSNLDMENQGTRNPKELFEDILNTLEEYTTEKAQEVLRHKQKILTRLKTHRPLKLGEYHYGLSEKLKKDRRLMVFEWENKAMVREYTQRNGRGGFWECLECKKKYKKKLDYEGSAASWISGIVFVAIVHDCKARDYKLVMRYQKYLEEDDLKMARRMGQKGFEFKQNSSTSMQANSIPTQHGNDKPSVNLKRKSNDNDRASSYAEPKNKKFKGKKSNNKNSSAVHDPPLQQQSNSPAVQMEEESVPRPSIFHFEKPSTSKLQEICDKLSIDYRNRAVKLWNKIKIEQTDTVSSPTNIEIHEYQTENFYEILSKLFTGKSNQHVQVQASIIEAFREKIVSSGEMKLKKFNKLYLGTVTDEHLSFIAQYLRCRILIFDGEEIRKYGKWNAKTSKRFTLVLYLSPEGYYSIVLSF